MSGSVLRTFGSVKIQNLLLILTVAVGVITWILLIGIFYTPPPPPEIAKITLVIASGALLGVLPIATIRAETAGCQNLLRILVAVLTATTLLYLFSRGIYQTYSLALLGSVIGLLTFSFVIDKFHQDSGTIFVFVWQFIVIVYIAILYWFFQFIQTGFEGVMLGALVLMTISLFAFHRSFIIERKHMLQS